MQNNVGNDKIYIKKNRCKHSCFPMSIYNSVLLLIEYMKMHFYHRYINKLIGLPHLPHFSRD